MNISSKLTINPKGIFSSKRSQAQLVLMKYVAINPKGIFPSKQAIKTQNPQILHPKNGIKTLIERNWERIRKQNLEIRKNLSDLGLEIDPKESDSKESI